MPESTTDYPTIAVRGDRVFAAHRPIWKEYLQNGTPMVERNRAATIIDPSDLEHSSRANQLILLEKNAIKPEALPSEIQSALPEIISHFRQLAEEEGLVDVGSDLQVEFQFIPTDVYLQVFPNYLATYVRLTRKFYISYDGIHTPQKIFELLVAVGHELRHRVARLHVEMVIKKEGGSGAVPTIHNNVLFELSRMHARQREGEENHFLEELFTVGWTLDHLADFIPPSIIQNYLDDFAQRNNVDRGRVTLRSALEKDGFLVGQQSDFLFIWNGYKEAIPNWEKLLIQARSGKDKSVAPLTQEIVRAFGKEGLLALSYAKDGTFEDHMLVFYYVFERRRQQLMVEEIRSQIKQREESHSGKVHHVVGKLKTKTSPIKDLVIDRLQQRLVDYEQMVAEKEARLHVLLDPLIEAGGYRGKKLSTTT